ncbi:MAG: DNA repair protein RecN [Rickettsiaceae bacterium]|nr:MAG: DNA repair protein RecN [Rickettsiaceae bacterium]
MLVSLSIRNFILIDELELEFKNGLCIVTGETGAGKSILIETILFCLGDKSLNNVMKPNSNFVSVTGCFDSCKEVDEILAQINIETDEQIIIKCVQHLGGRKKYLINDQLVTQKTLSSIAEYLLETHGQNSHTRLLNIATHIDILDYYGNLNKLKNAVTKIFKDKQDLIKKIINDQKQRSAIEKEIDYLSFATKELIEINIQPGEEEKLSNIRQKLQTKDKEIHKLKNIEILLKSQELDNIIIKAQRIISRDNQNSEELINISKNLDDAYNYIEQARQNLDLAINMFIYEEDIDVVEERLFKIRSLAKKYHTQSEELPKLLNNFQAQLNTLNNSLIDNEKLVSQAQQLQQEYMEQATLLSHERTCAAAKLKRVVQSELALLKMEKAMFKIELTHLEEGNTKGIDSVRFVASTNPGQPLAPIDVVASGGELSRLMLALKNSLLDKYSAATIIFDEIDTGIGGAVASSIGERLKILSTVCQVIVITHQPQVAAKADQHILVKKLQQEQTTKLFVSNLLEEDRVLEIGRMISGKIVTNAALKAAAEMLK